MKQSESPERKRVHVVAAVLYQDGRIFATQRGYGEYKDGWEFPGGKVEPQETPKAALIREIKEELDTDIRVEQFLCTVEYNYPSFHLSMDCYLCTVVSGDLILKEHKAARWLSQSELYDVDWLPADRELLLLLHDFLGRCTKNKVQQP